MSDKEGQFPELSRELSRVTEAFAAALTSLTVRAEAAEHRADNERSRTDVLEADLDRAQDAARAAKHRVETAETALLEQQQGRGRWFRWLLASSIERRSAGRGSRADPADLDQAHDAVRAAKHRAETAEAALLEQQQGRGRWFRWLLASSIERRSTRRRSRADLADLDRAHDAARAAKHRAETTEAALLEQQQERGWFRS
jgi:hypothetical protein